jgi:hypothetical protein
MYFTKFSQQNGGTRRLGLHKQIINMVNPGAKANNGCCFGVAVKYGVSLSGL